MDLKNRDHKTRHKASHSYRPAKNIKKEQPEPQILETSNDYLIEDHSRVLIQWEGPEHENYPKDRNWYILAFLVMFAIISYALITDNPIMAITFILIGVVGYIHIKRTPEVIAFKVTPDGIIAGNEMFAFENMKSFWILQKYPHIKTLSIKTKNIMPYIHFPIHQVDPEDVREALLDFIPEKKQDPSLMDVVERLLHL